MTQNSNTIFKNNDTFNYKLKKKPFANTVSKIKTNVKRIENICNVNQLVFLIFDKLSKVREK